MNIALLSLALQFAAPADAVYFNGRIWTGTGTTEATAIAVWQGRILNIGTDAEAKALAGPASKLIDLQNRRVVPGFYDSHMHLLGGGRSLAQVQLKDAADAAEFSKRLKEWDAKLSKSRWLLGGNWDHDRAFAGKLPTAAMVDAVVPERPVFLRRYDGHMALANTVALKLAGIDASTKDPPGGVIERGPDGKTPTGILKDNAMGMLDKLIPEPESEEIAEGIQAALAACSEAGITSVQDMDGNTAETRVRLFRAYQSLDRTGKLTVRVDLRWPIGAQAALTEAGIQANYGTPRLRIGGVKGFMDGSLGSSTAKMAGPYDIDKSTSGVYVTPPSAMQLLVKTASNAGLSIAIHAIGDEANHQLLNIYETAAMTPPPRFRIEHAQHLKPDDIKRFKALNVIASMQPYHVIDDGRWAEGRIGAKRCASSYAYRSLVDSGAVLAFGSDWPVAPLNVLEGIDAAVNRRTLDGKHTGGWFPKERITVAEALKAYTWGSAYAAHQDGIKGTLAVGLFADFVVLDTDILNDQHRDAIVKTKVDMTVMDGAVVFDRLKK